MSTKDNADGYKKAIRDATQVLQNTADDFDECAYRLDATRHKTPNELREVSSLREKAQLLRGQIIHIKELAS